MISNDSTDDPRFSLCRSFTVYCDASFRPLSGVWSIAYEVTSTLGQWRREYAFLGFGVGDATVAEFMAIVIALCSIDRWASRSSRAAVIGVRSDSMTACAVSTVGREAAPRLFKRQAGVRLSHGIMATLRDEHAWQIDAKHVRGHQNPQSSQRSYLNHRVDRGASKVGKIAEVEALRSPLKKEARQAGRENPQRGARWNGTQWVMCNALWRSERVARLGG